MTSLLSVSQPRLGHTQAPMGLSLPRSPKQISNLCRHPRGASLRSLSRTHLDQPPPTYITKAKLGLISHPPELCPEGTGGTYFMKDSYGTPTAVFKPENEDPLSKLNPKRLEGDQPLHFQGLLPCECSQREIFAYQVDKGFAGVPETHLAEVSHWVFTDNDGVPGTNSIKRKAGSMQEFASNIQCAVEDIGCSKFSLEDVQRIAVLDLLLANCDRNGGNILVKRDSCKLVPIDHGFCLPDFSHLSDIQWFEWMTWRQSKQPVLPEVIEFVDEFDVEQAASKAQALRIRDDCIITLRLCHIFVREALHSGCTLNEIAKLVCSRPQAPSMLEKLVARAYHETLHPGSALVERFAQQVALYFI